MDKTEKPVKARKTPLRPASLLGALVRDRVAIAGVKSEQPCATRATPADDRYQDMLRAAVDWYWETDAEHRLTAISSPVAASLGVPAQLLLGRNFLQLSATTESAKGESAKGEQAPAGPDLSAAMQRRQAFRDLAVTIDAGDGVAVPYRLSAVPIFDEASGRFAGFRGTGSKILESQPSESWEQASLVELLDALLARKDELEWQLVQAKDTQSAARLGRIAHELRTPLNAIIGFSEVIRDRLMGDDLKRYAEYGGNIHDSGHHLLELINNLLDAAEEEAEAEAEEPAAFAIAPEVEVSLRMVADRAAEAKVRLFNQLPEALPTAFGRPRSLRQILLNLLVNAVKYTPAGGRAGVALGPVDDQFLSLEVWDTGVGIPQDEHEKIFEESYRTRDGREMQSGSGFGLAISRDLARAMGGEISVASKPKKGSRFTLRLPLGHRPGGDKP